jgi:hypothetical protein
MWGTQGKQRLKPMLWKSADQEIGVPGVCRKFAMRKRQQSCR